MNSDTTTQVQVHLVCQAHLDPVWIWEWPEGLTETLATFETAADLLDEYPEFVFNHNESVLYEWTRENRPELFGRIREHVHHGRWVITGGWYLQPDANLPSGESLARHILIGRRFFQDEFDVDPSVAYNLDTFGHNANLPQFLALSGYSMYTHFRPKPEEKSLPDFLYRWRGVDGSEIIGFRPPCGWYCSHPGSLVESKIDEMRELATQRNRPTTAFWGAGNHGGGATMADLELIREVSQRHPGVVHSSFERYCSEVAMKEAPNLPVVTGELQKCFTGCYTSIIGNKSRNRRGEGLALAAERFAALAWWLLGEPFPAAKLSRIWKDVLFNQFHDILSGSSIRQGAVSAADMMGRSATDAQEVLLKAQLQLMRRKSVTEPLTLRVINPHPIPRTIPAIVDVQLATHPLFVEGKHLALYDSRGNEVCRQLLAYNRNTADWRSTFLFDADLPALGIAEYLIRIEDLAGNVQAADRTTDSPDDPDASIYFEGRKLHDDSCRLADHDGWHSVDSQTVTVDSSAYTAAISRESGALTSLMDRGLGRDFIAAPSCRLLVRADSNDAWARSQDAYGPVVGHFELPGAEELSEVTGQYGEQPPAPPVRVVASGPLAVVVESVLTYKRSVARLRYTFYRYHRHIDLDLMLNFSERRRAVQLEIATALPGMDYDAEIPHATVNRPRNGGEEPMGRWVMLSSGGNSLALVNDGPGGVDIAQENIRQTLVRTPVYCSDSNSIEPGFMGDHMDLGEHRYRFRILFGARDGVVSQRQLAADDLALPFSYHCSIPLGPSGEPGLETGVEPFLVTRIAGTGLVHMEAMKVSEDGVALVVRLAERTGARTCVRIDGHGVAPLELEFRAYEMKTIRCEKTSDQTAVPRWIECDLLERPLSRDGHG